MNPRWVRYENTLTELDHHILDTVWADVARREAREKRLAQRYLRVVLWCAVGAALSVVILGVL